MAGRRDSRRASVMEYEQSVIFGQYHEKLASFARLQARKLPKNRFEDDFDEENGSKSCLSKFLRFMAQIGNWPLLFCLGIIISFLSFVVDVVTAWLVLGKLD